MKIQEIAGFIALLLLFPLANKKNVYIPLKWQNLLSFLSILV